MTENTVSHGAGPVLPEDPGHAADPSTERLPEAIVDAAILWAVRLEYNTPTPEDWQDFDRWLGTDPMHGIAWDRIRSLTGFQGQLESLSPRLASDALRVVRQHRQCRDNGRRKVVQALSVMGVLVAAGWIAREHTPWQRVLADASTVIGEQKAFHLEDGSVILLNTDSAIRTDLSGPQRLVVLQRGEILITTGQDKDAVRRLGHSRPFRVQTTFGSLRALGTRFVVRLDKAGARIAVQEGAVELYPSDSSESTVVRSGEKRWLTRHGTRPAESHGLTADGWAEGIIAGRNIRLEDLLMELSRYRPGRIVCDPLVADLRLSGLFHVQDTDRALRFLARTQPIQVSYLTPYWVRVGPGEPLSR